MEMGTGKSKVLLDNIGMLYLAGQIKFALMIAPKGVYRNWVAKEIPEHMSDDVPHRVIRWVSTPNKKQQAEMRSVKDPFDGLTIFVMNVESFSTARARLPESGWLVRLVEMDDCRRRINHHQEPKAKRTKALMKIARAFKYKRLLTGSPITKSPMDIYSQCEFLRPGLLGHDSYYSFQYRYAVVQRKTMGSHSFQQIVGYKNLDELTDKIDSSAIVYSKRLFGSTRKDLHGRYVEMTNEQREMYNSIKQTSPR